jgi:hypothetical protein
VMLVVSLMTGEMLWRIVAHRQAQEGDIRELLVCARMGYS